MATACDGELLSLFNKKMGLVPYRSERERRFIRKIIIDKVENLWQRFTILPNVDGQKVRLWRNFFEFLIRKALSYYSILLLR